MGVVCKTKYLDKNGNLSSAYYNNKHLGHEKALDIYLESMKDYAYHKAQKGSMTKEDLIAKSNRIKLVENADGTSHYLDTKTGDILQRTTNALSSIQPDASDDFFLEKAKEKAIKNKAISLVMNEPAKYGYSKSQVRDKAKIVIDPEGNAMLDASKWSTEPESNFNKKVEEITDLWEFKTEAGTDAHRVAENYVEARNNADVEEDGYIDLTAVRAKALEGEDNKPEYEKLLREVERFLSKVEKGKKVEFVTELRMADAEMGIAGSIDLMAFDEDGNVAIFDYKTKEKGKEYMFDTQGFGRLKGAMSDLWNNKETQGALQTSIYRLMLERAGFKVIDTRILYVEADIEDVGGKFKYSDFVHKKDVNLPYYRTNLIKFFAARGVQIDKPRDIEPGKVSNAKELVSKLHGQDIESTVDINRKIAKVLNSGEDFYKDYHNGGKRVYFSKKNVESRTKELREYYEREVKMTSELAGKMLKYFNTPDKNKKGSIKGGNDILEMQANRLFAGLNIETHTMQQAMNIPGFSYADPNILVAKDRVDGSATFINIMNTYNSKVKFDDDKRTSIFGNYLSDSTVKRKLRDLYGKAMHNMRGLESNTQNYKQVEMGIMAMEMFSSGEIESVNTVRTGIVNGFTTDVRPKVYYMGTLVDQIRLINKLTEDDQPKYYKELFSQSGILDRDNYETDMITRLMFQLETGFSDISNRPYEKVILKNIKENLDKRQDGIVEDSDLVLLLIEAYEAMHASLSIQSDDISDIAKNEDARILAKTILQLTDSSIRIGEFAKIGADAIVRAAGRMENSAVQDLNSMVSSDKQKINLNFQKFRVQHKKVVDSLFKANGIGIKEKATKQDLASAFKNLWVVDPSLPIKSNEQRELYTFKDPKDKSLNSAESDYIKFFNDYVDKGFERGLGSNSTKYKNAFKTPEGKVSSWFKGRVPMMSATHENVMTRAEGLKDSLALIAQRLDNHENTYSDFSDVSSNLKDKYSRQIDNGYQGGETRSAMLGLNYLGDKVGDPVDLETNPETILNNFYIDNLMIDEYKTSVGVYKAINLVAAIEQNEHFNDTKDLRNYMKDLVKYVVFNERNNKANPRTEKFMQYTHKGMSLMALGLSAKQFVLEGGTNSIASLSSVMQQSILQVAGAEHRFTAKNWVEAVGLVVGHKVSRGRKVVDALINEWGLYKIDPETLSSKEFIESKKNFMFQSKWAYFLNNIPYKLFKTITVVSQLIHMGVFEAMSVDSKGHLTYDATKDKRFTGIFDRNGNLYKDIKKESPLFRKKLEYEFLIETLKAEDGVSEDGKPLRPVPTIEITTMQDYSLSLYGSMDKDAKMIFQSKLLGILVMKFKGWIPIKFQNYYTDTHISRTRSEKVFVKDATHEDGGYFDYQAQINEGIIQTVVGLSSGLYDIYKVDGFKNGNFKGEFSKLDKAQQENLAKLVGDIILISILLSGILAAMGDDEENKKRSAATKMVLEVLLNSTSDLNMLSLTKSLSEQGPIAALGYAMRSVDAIKKSIAYIADGEVTEGLMTPARMFGSVKSFEAMVGE